MAKRLVAHVSARAIRFSIGDVDVGEPDNRERSPEDEALAVVEAFGGYGVDASGELPSITQAISDYRVNFPV